MPNPIPDELPPLTDQDVEILYTIVANAQNATDPSFRALFAAYDSVLSERGIEPDHDQVYFRFLLRMGHGRKEGESLFDRFETLLGQMGIQIEVGKEGDGVEDITRNLDDFGLSDNEPSVVDSWPSQLPQRRASFDSIYDINLDNTRTSHDGGNFQSLRSRLRKSKPRQLRAASWSIDTGAGQHDTRHALRRYSEQSPRKGRLNGRAASYDLPSKRPRAASISSQGSFKITRNARNGHSRSRHGTSAGAGADNLSMLFDDARLVTDRLYPENGDDTRLDDIANVPDSKMEADAENTGYQRIVILAHKYFRHWRDQALEMRQYHQKLDLSAELYDRAVLLRQALGEWRAALHLKRQVAETERFFTYLERRADKARNLFLLTKAFTHWAQSSSDEVMRTSVARRHILRTRYFNAWRDITVVNELKVRRQGLRKYFALWRHKNAVFNSDGIRAVAFHDDHLTERVYWRWFWVFCERRAPIWAAGRVKRNFFSKWVDIVRQLRERDALVAQIRSHDVERRCLLTWSSKIRQLQSLSIEADNLKIRALLSSCLKTLTIQAKVAPLVDEYRAKANIGLVRKAFCLWADRARLLRQATAANLLRIKRNAWTSWNDRLRCQVLSSHINDRVLIGCLYKWVLVSRCALLTRIRRANVKREFLLQWHDNFQKHKTCLAEACRSFNEARLLRIRKATFQHWRQAAQNLCEGQIRAMSVYRSRMLGQVFQQWLSGHRHIERLASRAAAANFYLLCTHSIAKWRAASQTAQRERERFQRREAYAVVRRRAKLQLLRQVFGKWSVTASEVVALKRQANQVYDDKILVLSAGFFKSWRVRADEVSANANYASQLPGSRAVERLWRVWRQRVEHQKDLEIRAAMFREDNLEMIASSFLKRINWLLFQLQRQQDTALALRERNHEKHIRRMLKYWADQTKRPGQEEAQQAQMDMRASPTRGRTVGPLAPEPGPGDLETNNDGLNRPKDEHALDEEAQLDISFFSAANDTVSRREPAAAVGNMLTSTPLPAYLRTPSKRNLRSKTLSRAFGQGLWTNTTPATAPAGMGGASVDAAAITPFQRKLQAQGYSERRTNRLGSSSRFGGRTGSRAGEKGTGGAVESGAFAGFEDIPEDDRSRDVGDS